MVDVDNQNDVQQEQCDTTDHNISLLIEQIHRQLIRMLEDDLELTEQLTSLYEDLCHLRKTLTTLPETSSPDISGMPVLIDSPTSTHYQTKPRSDSEPNILSDCWPVING